MGGLEILILLVGALVGAGAVYWWQETRIKRLEKDHKRALRKMVESVERNYAERSYTQSQLDTQATQPSESQVLPPTIMQATATPARIPQGIATTPEQIVPTEPRSPEEPTAAIASLPTEPMVNLAELSDVNEAAGIEESFSPEEIATSLDIGVEPHEPALPIADEPLVLTDDLDESLVSPNDLGDLDESLVATDDLGDLDNLDESLVLTDDLGDLSNLDESLVATDDLGDLSNLDESLVLTDDLGDLSNLDESLVATDDLTDDLGGLEEATLPIAEELPEENLEENLEEPLEESLEEPLVTQIFAEPPAEVLALIDRDRSDSISPPTSTPSASPTATPIAPPVTPFVTSASDRATSQIALWEKLDSPKHIPQLLQYAHHPNANVRLHAATALAQIASAHNIHAHLAQVMPALKRLSSDRHLQIRYQAIVALGQSRSPLAIPILTTALRDPASQLVKAASTALGNLKYYLPLETTPPKLPARVVYKKPVR